jgi:hypothetical protein
METSHIRRSANRLATTERTDHCDGGGRRSEAIGRRLVKQAAGAPVRHRRFPFKAEARRRRSFVDAIQSPEE